MERPAVVRRADGPDPRAVRRLRDRRALLDTTDWPLAIRRFALLVRASSSDCYPIVRADGTVMKWWVRDTGWFTNEGERL